MLPTERLPVTIHGTAQPLLLHWMRGHEELGRLFEYELEIYTETLDLPFEEILGKPLTVCVSKGGGIRYFNGIVTRLVRMGAAERYLAFRATLSPKLWLLRKTTDCRIYPNKSVLEVVKQVLREHAITFSESVQASDYRTWDYLTQYRESDFAFISRIMEREGIYYYFKHTQDGHELVLSDSLASHDPVNGYELIPVRPRGSAQTEREHFTSWRIAHEITSVGMTLQAHDFRLPRGAKIKAVAGVPAEHEQDDFQLYDYSGHYVGAQNLEAATPEPERAAGEHYAKVQLDEQRTELERIEGEGNVRGLQTGALFKFEDLAAPTDNFLVTSTQYEFRNPGFQTGEQGGDSEVCHLSFSCINTKRQFRPARITDKPLVAGPESAIVVGKKGEDITTDVYGRVRIQFHWDREGKSNEASTCWVRVGQMWAGTNWGSIFIPRFGQEVIVQFLGGDPDRPIITGSVYNASNMPPYTLPDNKTQSGIKSRSTLEGGPDNFNEIRFEDKKDHEELHIQAERDQSTHVKRNQSISVDGDRSVSVGGNESISVTGTRTSTITKKETQTFKDDRLMTVAKTNTDEVTLLHTGTYKKGRTETVSAVNDTLTVNGANKVVTVHGEYNTVADTQFQVMQGANQIFVKDEIKIISVGEIKVDNEKSNLDLKDGVATLTSATEIKLVCGQASISLKSDGTIEINGAQKVSANGAGSGLELVQAGATMSGPKATVSGASMTEITGAMVKIN